MIRKCTLLIILLFILIRGAQAQDLETISRNYIDYYFSKNEESFKALLHDSITWSDPTWSEIDPSNKPVSGKSAVINHLRSITAGIAKIDYRIDNQFISGNHAVFEGQMEYSWTDPESEIVFDFSIREVTVLRFKDGLVNEHTDYGDFRKWRNQYISQAKQ